MANQKSELHFAFLRTVPVLLGYLCLGMGFGLMLQDVGYHFVWAFFCSLFIYSGSMQYMLVTLLSGGASLVYAALMTLFINGRHIFYGISFVDSFKQMGKAYPYMIFSLTDETYSVICSLRVPKGLNENRVKFFIALLDHGYWITGCVLGCVLGQLISFNTAGVDFSMTALFIVIVMNQWKENGTHLPAIIAAIVGISFLIILGPDKFLLPALIAVVIPLSLFKKKILSLKEEEQQI